MSFGLDDSSLHVSSWLSLEIHNFCLKGDRLDQSADVCSLQRGNGNGLDVSVKFLQLNSLSQEHFPRSFLKSTTTG